MEKKFKMAIKRCFASKLLTATFLHAINRAKPAVQVSAVYLFVQLSFSYFLGYWTSHFDVMKY